MRCRLAEERKPIPGLARPYLYNEYAETDSQKRRPCNDLGSMRGRRRQRHRRTEILQSDGKREKPGNDSQEDEGQALCGRRTEDLYGGQIADLRGLRDGRN